MTKDFRKVAIGSDHAGVASKAHCLTVMQQLPCDTVDVGVYDEAVADYPDIAQKLAEMLIRGEVDGGILICGTGIGMSIAANRFAEVRAALCHTPEEAALARQHNNANILVLGARILTQDTIDACIQRFFTTAFEGGRHQSRVDKLTHNMKYEAKL